jgi:transposase
MKKIHDVLRLHYEAKLSHRKIARACGISKGIVSRYLALAKARGIPWPLPPGWDETELEVRLHPGVEKPARFVEPDFAAMHQELKRKGVTLQLLWSEYATAHGAQAYRYSQFCLQYQQWRARQRRSMRQVHKAGEKLFIDYCGPTVPVVDGRTGELRQAQVFVAVLGASSYTNPLKVLTVTICGHLII